MGEIYVGTCSWTDPTLVKSTIFYPRLKMSAEERLRFYSERFQTVEVDSTFYTLPSERMVQLQAERTPPGFVLHYKAFGLFTLHSVDPGRLPIAVKELLSPELLARRTLRFEDFPEDARELAFSMFESALRPAEAAGKLGVMVFQLPPFVTKKSSNFDYLLFLRERFPDMRMAVEFRHSSWIAGGADRETLRFLEDNGLIYVSVDEPQFPSGVTVPPVAAATAPIAYVRFHGRNQETWFKRRITTAERFAYLYEDSELAVWADRLRSLSAQADTTYGMFNNCYADYAVRNATRMQTLTAFSAR